ncbi:DUF1566 domain-containing protein [Cupriavidus basilensis]|uniref:DUF1566 domain-containing protein n=1 Tax=Cupriavidus basilensis TaxID=68895 RepID=A0ABT6AWU7_9BURK|nr:DUF1566 domain-containing protein [Cupriavidus basilensis]MDF3837106.1 DUF1566 domain-containing protein [Cupriavidus basilensis]
MNAVTAVEAIAVQTTISQAVVNSLRPGDAIGGGFYASLIRQIDGIYALVVAPKDGGEHKGIAWNSSTARVDGAISYYDGYANTLAMAEAGSELAKLALSLQLNGFHDWYLGARDEMEVIYRNLKPTAGNYASFRDGENPSSVPVGYAYTETSPGQTACTAFQEGGVEAFADAWYHTSTQSERDSDYAWLQNFGNGTQINYRKNTEFCARFVRRLKVIQ